MKSSRRITLLLAALALGGCANANTLNASATPRIEASAPSSGGQGHADGPMSCVMEVMGTGLHHAETQDGIALTFQTVSPEHVNELRNAVRGLAGAYDGTLGATPYGRHDRGERRSPQQMGLPGLRAVVEPLRDGARLVVSAADRRQVELLRERIGAQAHAMQRGACPLFVEEQ